MTTNEGDAAALIQTLQQNAKRLGLSWDLTMATVLDGFPGSDVSAVFDADAETNTPTQGLISMIGAVAPGARVYVVQIPPAGNYIVGMAQPGRFYARQTLESPQTSIFFPVPPNLRQLTVSYSAECNLAAATAQIRMRLNGNAANQYLTEITQGNAAATVSQLIDPPNPSAFVGLMAGTGSAGVRGSGQIWFQGWDLAKFRFPTWTFNNGSIITGGFDINGAGIFAILGSLTRVDFLPQGGASFIAGTDFQLEGVFS